MREAWPMLTTSDEFSPSATVLGLPKDLLEEACLIDLQEMLVAEDLPYF
jgi:hypothetical protein